MAGGKSWIRQALATVFSQWHFHLDLLDLWRNELASTSLALFVMGRPDDLATYQKMLSYYEQLITLFAFDTGYDPLVCIYDGEIRSSPWLYEFFSKSPIYQGVSDRYYNSKLEDVNTQFTEQFLSNLALFWSVIIPDIFAHMGASAPQALFESKANKLISLRKTTLANAGDFIKWMSHNYSLALKNYVPFVASPELWRAYNPFIDLYWWTIYGHILCLRAFQSIEASSRIKPFIETQSTRITFNGQPIGEARLIGDGIITTCIPNDLQIYGENKLCFNSYGVIACLSNVMLKYWGFCLGYKMAVLPGTTCTLSKTVRELDTGHEAKGKNFALYAGYYVGFNFHNHSKIPLKLTFSWETTPSNGTNYEIGGGIIRWGNEAVLLALTSRSPSGRGVLHVPAREYFTLMVGIHGNWPLNTQITARVHDIVIEPDDPDYTDEFTHVWLEYADTNPYQKIPFDNPP